MATSKNTKKPAPGTLAPTVVKNETQAMDIATSSGRKRPFVAINDDGKLVVCSRRTASKYGWETQGALYTRSGGSDKAPAKKETKASKAEQQWREAVQGKADATAPAQARNLSRRIKNIVRNELRSRFSEKG